MANPAKKSKVSNADISGLETLFEPSQNVSTVQGNIENTDDWTVEEAADYLGLSAKTIRRRLRDGSLQGHKIWGTNGPCWRVSALEGKVHGTVDDVSLRGSPSDPSTDGQMSIVLGLMETQSSKLEAALVEIGSLRAQLDEKERTLRLIEDKRQQVWWRRAWSWMTIHGA
jgi:excisionase family DNA binding protein